MPFDPDPTSGVATAFPAIFGVVVVIIVIGFVATFVSIAVRAKRVVDAGHNPLTLETDIALKVLDSQVLAPEGAAPTVEERLSRLDALRASGTITAEEHDTARARILDSI